jgi:D-glycero-D-manno-heptose 1,7-bisphosphate phosphatase
MKRAVFLDRDGVINRVSIREGKPYSPRQLGDFRFIDGIEQLVAALKEAGYITVVVTNQPDVARGLVDREAVEAMNSLVREKLPVDEIRVCFHDDSDGCDCRKPRPGMITSAAEKWGLDLARSFIVGDTWRDMEAGRRAGCRTILMDAPYNREVKSDHRVGNLREAFDIVRGCN